MKTELKNIETISLHGIKRYYNNDGLLHRDDGPALVEPGGNQYWYKEGVWHREDGPAGVEDGRRIWRAHGIWHTKLDIFLRAIEKSLNLSEFWK